MFQTSSLPPRPPLNLQQEHSSRMSHEDFAYEVPRPMTPAQKAAAKQASIEQARLQGAEIATDQDGITWAITEGFPGLTVKRRMD